MKIVITDYPETLKRDLMLEKQIINISCNGYITLFFRLVSSIPSSISVKLSFFMVFHSPYFSVPCFSLFVSYTLFTICLLVKIPWAYELLAYHNLGENKYDALGRTYELHNTQKPSVEFMENLVEKANIVLDKKIKCFYEA